jgi:hypothetical protein
VTQLRKAMLEEFRRRNLSPITTRICLRFGRGVRALLQQTARSARPGTHCGTRSPPICSKQAPTCAPFNC